MFNRGEPYRCGGRYIAEPITTRAPFDNTWQTSGWAGAKLGAGHVHQDAARFTQVRLRAPKVFNHPAPSVLMIMSTIDTHAIHAASDEIPDYAIIICCFARHGDHNTYISPGRFRT
jgi:hypothetical protein